MNTSFELNIAKLISSRVIMQVVIVLSAPIISRIFLPEHFGLMQICESIAALFCFIACLGYEFSIPLGNNRNERNASFLLSLLATLFMTFACLIFVLCGREALIEWFNAPGLHSYLWLLPSFVLMQGFIKAFDAWAAFEGRFDAIAWAGVGSMFCDKLSTIGAGTIFSLSAVGLFIGRTVGFALNMVILSIFLGRTLLAEIRSAPPSIPLLQEVALRHKKFPLFHTWSTLLATISLELPALFFGVYFPPAVVGHYSWARRVGGLIVILSGPAFAQVFFPAAAKAYRETGIFSSVVQNTVTRLVQLCAFPMTLLVFFGGGLFTLVFGQQWSEAGIYLQILAPWYFFAFLNRPLEIFQLVNRQELALVMTMISILGRFLGLWIGAPLGQPRLTLAFFSVFSVLIMCGQLALKFRLSQVSWIWASKTIVFYLALSCVFLIPVIFISRLVQDIRVLLFLLCIAAVGYGGVVITNDPTLKQFAGTMIGKMKRGT